MSGYDHEDDARPIPQGRRRGVPVPERAARREPSYTVDTRRKVSLSRGRSGAEPEWDQGYAASGGPVPAPAGAPPGPSGPRRRRGRYAVRRVLVLVLVAVLAWLAFLVWVPFRAWNSVERVDYTPAAARPADTGGRNYLLVGSDSRAGMTPEQAAQYGTESEAPGKRTDTIMIVHISESGQRPAVISIPRDSYLPIPGHGSNKVNAAFALGGAELLTRTLEQATGLHIDGYLEIGFGGFASVVDSLGGVQICVERAMQDDMAGLDVPAGCQVMDGPTALAYVRARYTDPRGDLGRAERQRQFLGAVTKQAASPGTVLIPTRYTAFADAVSKGLVVGDGTSLRDAVSILQALRGVGTGEADSLVVPIENPAYQTRNAGVAVKWHDAQAKSLFTQLREDRAITVPSATKG